MGGLLLPTGGAAGTRPGSEVPLQCFLLRWKPGEGFSSAWLAFWENKERELYPRPWEARVFSLYFNFKRLSAPPKIISWERKAWLSDSWWNLSPSQISLHLMFLHSSRNQSISVHNTALGVVLGIRGWRGRMGPTSPPAPPEQVQQVWMPSSSVWELERAWCHPGNEDHVGLQQREPVSGISWDIPCPLVQ